MQIPRKLEVIQVQYMRGTGGEKELIMVVLEAYFVVDKVRVGPMEMPEEDIQIMEDTKVIELEKAVEVLGVYLL